MKGTDMTSLDVALTVGVLYPVFPCGRNKRPLWSNDDLAVKLGTKGGIPKRQGGCKIASQDPKVIKQLWTPSALVGVHTVDLVCIDWDAYKKERAANDWVHIHLPLLEQARTHQTKSGGFHYIFRLPPGMKLPGKIKGIDSIDIKAGVGSYFIWPTEGSGYGVVRDVDPPLLPQGLIDAIGDVSYEGGGKAQDWTPNPTTDDELVSAVLAGGDYHAALATLTMRWALRTDQQGQRPTAEDLINQSIDLLRRSKPNQKDRQERRDALIADEGGELSRLCEGAVRRATPVDPFEGLEHWLEKEEDDPFVGIDLNSSPFFQGDPAAAPPPKVINAPERRVAIKPPEPRQWLHGRYLIRGHMTMTAAPGGTGKSTAVMTELLEIACQKNVTGQKLWRPAKVLYINGEDPIDEIERRLYACILKHGFDRDLIAERFWYYSGRDFDGGLHFVEMNDSGVVEINKAAVEVVERLIDESGAEIVCIDPLSSFHGVNENSNSEVRGLMDALRSIAHSKGVSFHMVHHSVKEAIQNKAMGAESARGASAFLDACRIVRTLRHLTKDENKRAGMQEGDKSLVRTVIGKGNMTQAGDGTFMFKLSGIDLGNGDEVYPEGDNVGVIEASNVNIEADSFDDMHWQADAARALLDLSREDQEYRVYPGSGPRHTNWLGNFMMKALAVEVNADMDAALSLLEAEGYLRVEQRKDKRQGRAYAAYVIDVEACERIVNMMAG